MSETLVLCLVFGILFLLNGISLLLLHTTNYGKNYYESLKQTESSGYLIFFNIWMLLTGVAYWIAFGVGELIQAIRTKKWKKVS